ncbi:MAG TPA: ARMT1-like domain-containing protein, partial [Alkalispirochaeta sp.]|nr:ARMT1-like domain-containing protein [Alkalispirochaeta sp.]
ANIANVIRAHPDYPQAVMDALAALSASIAGNHPIPPPPLPSWDHDTWRGEYQPYATDTWHDTEWFFAETYAFRLILSASRYFETRIDPYGPMKEAELDSGAPFLPVQRFFAAGGPAAAILNGGSIAADAAPTLLEEALHLAMWGNKADISFAAGGALDHSAGERELLLRDDSIAAATILSKAKGTVHIIMDNSGAELAGDLVAALTIIHLTGAAVVLHPKLYPTYVSDTTVEDIHTYLDRATQSTDPTVRQLASAVRTEFRTGAISLAPDDFWCTTRFLSGMPPRIEASLDGTALVIVKGDFNYRRVFRDTIWPAGTDPRDAAGAEFPYPILLLRTMKSDCLVGVPEEVSDSLDATEPGWRTAGARGIIQLMT